MDKLYILGSILGALTQASQAIEFMSRLPRRGDDVVVDGDVSTGADVRLASIDAFVRSLPSPEEVGSPEVMAALGDTAVYATGKLKNASNILHHLSTAASRHPRNPAIARETVIMLTHVAYLGYLIGVDMHTDESRRLVFPYVTIYVSKFKLAKFRGLYFSSNDGRDLIAVPTAVRLPPTGSSDLISVSYSISGVSALLTGLNNRTLISRLISTSFFDASGTELSLEFADSTFISAKVEAVPEHKQPACAFIRKGQWSTDGCQTTYPTEYDLNTVECRCSRPSLFGIILIDQPHITHIGVSAMIGSGFTVLFCLITALVFIGYRLMHSIRCYIRFSFLTALALAEIMYLCIRYTEAPAMCTMIAAGAHFFALASFTWLLSYALFLGNDIIGDDDTSLHVTHYTFLGWAVPLAVVLISFIWRYDSYVHDRYCWISDKHGLPYAFVLPICFVIVITLCVLLYDIAVYSSISQPKKTTTLKVSRSGLRSCCCLLPVLSTVWLMAHFMVNIGYLSLQIVFSLLNIVLGVMLFLIMFWFNEEVAMKLNSKTLNFMKFWKKPKLLVRRHVTSRTMEMTLTAGGLSPKPGTSAESRRTMWQEKGPDARHQEGNGNESDETALQESPYLKVIRPAPIASSEDSLLTKDSEEGAARRDDVAIGPADLGDSSTMSLLPEHRS